MKYALNMAKRKTMKIMIMVVCLVLLSFFVTGSLLNHTTDFSVIWSKTDDIVSIHTYKKMNEIRDNCSMSAVHEFDLLSYCNLIVNNNEVRCVTTEKDIRSSCVIEYINLSIFGGRDSGATLPCTSPPELQSWNVSWFLNKSGQGTFLWCKI